MPLANGSSELVVSVAGRPEGRIVGFDPKTGNELWRSRGIPDGYVCPSVVAHDGVVYAIGGRRNTALAVRAGGRGDVSDSHILWTTNKGSNVSSPVYYEGHLYWVHENQGLAYCLDAKTGETVYAERLAPRPGLVYSSITAADGKLYAVSQHNGAYVLAAKPQFELLRTTSLLTTITGTMPRWPSMPASCCCATTDTFIASAARVEAECGSGGRPRHENAW